MEQLELAIQEIKQEMPGLELKENEPMSGHCSFRIGGPVRALAAPQDVTGLTRLCYLLKKHELAPYILGNGTNILFPDEGLKDLFIISRTAQSTPRPGSRFPGLQASRSKTA